LINKRHIIQLAVFALVLLGIDRAVYAAAIYARDSATTYGKLSEIYRPSEDYGIVIFGSSRAYLHYDVSELSSLTGQSVFNFGLDGTNAEQHLFELEEYLRRGGSPEMVVFEADPESLDPSFYRFKREIFRDYLSESGEATELLLNADNPVVRQVERFTLTKAMKSWAFAGRIETLARSWLNSDSSQFCLPGVACEYEGGSILIDVRRTREFLDSELAERVKQIQIDEGRKQMFKRLVDLSAQHGFKLALVETPRHRAGETLDPLVTGEAREFFCGLANGDDATTYLHPSDDARWDDPDLYFDGDHLNAAGAKAATSAIGVEILRGAAPCRAY
jgi:hypothetical protein